MKTQFKILAIFALLSVAFVCDTFSQSGVSRRFNYNINNEGFWINSDTAFISDFLYVDFIEVAIDLLTRGDIEVQGDLIVDWNILSSSVTATDSITTAQLNMNGESAMGIAGSSELDVLFKSLTFSDTTEVWGYKQLFQADNGRMYGMVEPHVFLYNPVDVTGVTQEIGITWEQFLPGDTSFFEFAGLQNMDSIGNDTIGVQFSGHYWINGNIVISGSTGRTIDIRLYNVTKAEPIKSGGSVTAQGTGNRMSLTMDGYCENCHADDKIIIQMQADQVTTFIFYSGRISIKGNHGFE